MVIQLEKINTAKLRCVPEKKSGYRLSHNLDKIRIETPFVKIPFGFEHYQKKEILNLLITENDNEKNNFVHDIKNLENYIANPIHNMHPNYKTDINGKTYTSALRNNGGNGYMMRINVKKSDNIDIVDSKGNLVYKNDIIHKNCKCIIELSSVWLYGDKYGPIWNLINIVVD